MAVASVRPSLWSAAPLVAAIAAACGIAFVEMRPHPEPVVELPPPVAVDTAPVGALEHPFGELSAPAKPQTVEALQFAPEEIARFSAVAAQYRKGAFPQGDAIGGAITDPIQRTALDWMALRVATNPQRLDAFLQAHPDWPIGDWARTLREGWLFSGKPTPTETISTLGKAVPLTGEGDIALARAKLALGQRAEVEALVRSAWRDVDLDAISETTLLREFGAMLTRDDHRARASRLAYAERGAAAWRAAALAGPDIVALVNARLEAARGPLSARTSSAVPQAVRNDPGYIFAHVQDSRRAGRLDEAMSWLQLAPNDPEKLIDADKWWSERRMIARAWIDRGAYDKAYAAAANGVAASSPSRVDAAFHAGWIALRFLNDAPRAAKHFNDAIDAAETPISIARAYYWRGRAAEALGGVENAHGFYAKAASFPIAYYGQLAARKLGASEITLRRPQTAAVGDARAEATRVVELFLAAGLDDYVAPVAYAAARTWDDESQLAAMAQVLRAKADASINVTFGKLATMRGLPLDAVAFPTFGVPEFEPLPGSAGMGQVLAVTRQESEFIPRAASGAGAKGLMQILPSTAADTARKAGVPFDYGRLLNDSSYNMQLGAAFLGQLVAAEGGSLEMAAAAYNAGGGRVAQWVNAYGDPRSGADLVDWVERIPYDETRDYVMRVAENYGVYQARLAEAPEPRAAGILARK